MANLTPRNLKTNDPVSTTTGTETQTIHDLLYGFDDRFEKVIAEIKKHLKKSDKVLDIACGEGKIWQLFPNYNITGLDYSRKNLHVAEKYLKPVFGDAEKLPFTSHSFDFVLASEIIEHLFSPDKLISEINRVLKKGGYALITFPNSASISFRLSILLWGRNPGLNYPENQNHIRFFDLSDMRKLMQTTSLEIVNVRGAGFLSFSKVDFGLYIPVPRKIRVLGGDLFTTLSKGVILTAHKKIQHYE